MKKKHAEDEEALIVEEILSFHQEKRNALKTIRIGIAMVAAQLSLLSVLMTTTAYPAYIQSRHWVIPFVALNALFFGLTLATIVVPLIRIRRLDQNIMKFKAK